MALGAKRRDIVGLVIGEGFKLASVGVAVGIVMALSLTGLLRALLFGVTTTDPMTFVSVSVVLFLIVAAACYIPASRALGVDPATSLRPD